MSNKEHLDNKEANQLKVEMIESCIGFEESHVKVNPEAEEYYKDIKDMTDN